MIYQWASSLLQRTNMEVTLTQIQLTPADALLFVEFQKRHSFIKALESIDAFAIRSGSLTVNFDAVGKIGSMEVHKHYRV